MAFRQGELLQLKLEDPKAWAMRVRTAIVRHRGILRRCANDLDVSYSTLKRWVNEEPSFRALIRKQRAMHQARMAA